MELILISNNNNISQDCQNMLHVIMTVKTNPKIFNDPNGPSHHQFLTMITHTVLFLFLLNIMQLQHIGSIKGVTSVLLYQ
jgi:hypothetical protein